jgi:hypothetical protein
MLSIVGGRPRRDREGGWCATLEANGGPEQGVPVSVTICRQTSAAHDAQPAAVAVLAQDDAYAGPVSGSKSVDASSGIAIPVDAWVPGEIRSG